MSKLKPPVSAADHIAGNISAAIELVEYGDYQCPHCGHAHPIIKAIQQKMGDKLKFVFRNFPLAEIHPNATHAAVAAEAAAAQGKFWEMHDIIFKNQQRLGDADLIKYAARTGLDTVKFENDFEKPEFLAKVESDFENGLRSGVNGTPSFFVNGNKYNGDWQLEPFLAYLQGL